MIEVLPLTHNHSQIYRHYPNKKKHNIFLNSLEKKYKNLKRYNPNSFDQCLHFVKQKLPSAIKSEYFSSSYKINSQINEYGRRLASKNRVVKKQNLFVRNQQNQRLMLLNNQYESKYFKNLALTPQQLKQMVHTPKPLCMSYGKYTPQQIIYAVKSVENQDRVVPLISLYLAWTRTPNILNVITPNKYTKLKVLNIGGSHIQSIEQLTKLDAPQLSEIWAWNNSITTLKSLRKCNLLKLKVIDMNTNKIIQSDEMREFGSSELKKVNISNNKCISLYGFIVLLSNKAHGTVSLCDNECPKIMRLPQKRRRQSLISIRPSLMTGNYS